MTQHITRIPYDEFARDVPGFLDRVAKTGDRVEVLWGNGAVALVRQGRSRADEGTKQPLVESARIVHDVRDLQPPSPALVAQRRTVLERAQQLRAEIAAANPTAVYDAVGDMRAAREERDQQLERL